MEISHYDNIARIEKEHWWYRVRRDIVKRCVNMYSTKDKPTILDVGCGPGLLMSELSRSGEVYGVDISKQAIEYARAHGLSNVVQADILNLPFSDGMFDVVLALDVIEHVEDDAGALKEIKRVLKPGGVVIIFVPAFMFLWGSTDDLSHHLRRYKAKDLINVIEEVNLRLLRLSYFNFLLFLPIALVRIFVRKFGIKIKPEAEINNKIMNTLFYVIFKLEEMILRKINLPFGVSILGVAKKI